MPSVPTTGTLSLLPAARTAAGHPERHLVVDGEEAVDGGPERQEAARRRGLPACGQNRLRPSGPPRTGPELPSMNPFVRAMLSASPGIPVTTTTRAPPGTNLAIPSAARRPAATLSVPMYVVIWAPTAFAASRSIGDSTLTIGVPLANGRHRLDEVRLDRSGPGRSKSRAVAPATGVPTPARRRPGGRRQPRRWIGSAALARRRDEPVPHRREERIGERLEHRRHAAASPLRAVPF